MTLEYSSVTEKRLSLLCQLPESIQGTLSRVWQQHYEELYEPEEEDAASLQDALDEILEVFQSNNQTLSHIRYVWMALILASVVEPTVQYYQPLNLLPQKTISKIELWLLENIEKMLDSKRKFSNALREEEFNDRVARIQIDYTNKKVENFQIIFEALDVYRSAIKTLDYNQSLESLLDILENCLEGYAIFPGSHGRRELFDWWLLEVVPASWYLMPPSSIYSLDKLGNEKNNGFCQMNKLNEISSAMWSIICSTASTSRQRSKLRTFPNNFEDYLNTIPGDVRLDKWAS